MMKSKRNQYVLLIGVVIIWALVIYRFASISGNDDSKVSSIPLASTSRVSSLEGYAYIFKLNYRDPFLNKSIVRNRTRSVENIKAALPIKPPSERIPSIELKGIVVSDNSKIAVIQIQELIHLLKEGEEAEGFNLIEIQSDFIHVHFLPMDTSLVIGMMKN